MKQFCLLGLAALLLFGTACKKDEVDNLLNYDGENQTAPLLTAGVHELAARFTSDLTGPYAGRQLLAVQYFMGPKPQIAELHVYGVGGPDFPGNLLYSANITDEIRTLSWNEHVLSTPVDIAAEDLWISIIVTHAAEQQSLGCDNGDRYLGNGDWLFQSSDLEWKTFRERTGEEVNWNIRGRVSEE